MINSNYQHFDKAEMHLNPWMYLIKGKMKTQIGNIFQIIQTFFQKYCKLDDHVKMSKWSELLELNDIEILPKGDSC